MSKFEEAKVLGLVKAGDSDAATLRKADPERAAKLAEFIRQNMAALVGEVADSLQ